MAGEDAVHVAHFVNDENAESHAEQAGGDAENAVHARESLLRIFERHGNGRGDQHHAGDSPHAEYQQVGDGPARVANGGEHQQRHRRRAGQPVNQSHRQRTQRLIQTELAENAVHPADGCGFGSVAMLFGIVPMHMAVNEIAMNVRMRMRMRVRMRMRGIGGGRERLGDPAREACKIQNSQQDQHQADGQLHGEAEPRRNYHSKKNDRRAHQKNRDGMAQSPQHSDQSGLTDAALAAHDGGDGDHVVRIGGVAHAQKKSQRDDGEQSDHLRVQLVQIDARPARYTSQSAERGILTALLGQTANSVARCAVQRVSNATEFLGRLVAGASDSNLNPIRTSQSGILTAVLPSGETKRRESSSNLLLGRASCRAVSGAQILWKKGVCARLGRRSPMQAIPVSEFITKLRASQAHDAKLIFSYAPCTLDVSAKICKLRFSTMATPANPLEERLQDFQFPQREAAFFYGLFLRGHSADELRKDIQVPAAVLAKWDKETVREPQLRPILETIVRYRQHVLAIFENLICHDAATQKLQ